MTEINDPAAQDLAALKQWLNKMPHIRVRDHDQHLVTFLRGCEYSLEKAKAKLEQFYSTRSRWYEMMTEKDPIDSTMILSINTGLMLPLNIESFDPDGPLIVLSTCQRWDPYTLPVEPSIKCNIKQVDVLIAHGKCATVGIVSIIDMAYFPIEYFNPSDVNEFVLLFAKTLPIDLKALHLINVSRANQFVINIVKSFLTEKLQKRIQFHKTLTDLHRFVDPKLLPHEYGGTSGPLTDFVARWGQVVRKNSTFLTNLQSYGIDNSKRLPNNAKEDHGSFRSLAID